MHLLGFLSIIPQCLLAACGKLLAQEVSWWGEITCDKMLTEISFGRSNLGLITARENDIVEVDGEHDTPLRSALSHNSGIRDHGDEAIGEQQHGELVEPGARALLQAIDCLLQETYQRGLPLSNIPRRLLHMDSFC